MITYLAAMLSSRVVGYTPMTYKERERISFCGGYDYGSWPRTFIIYSYTKGLYRL